MSDLSPSRIPCVMVGERTMIPRTTPRYRRMRYPSMVNVVVTGIPCGANGTGACDTLLTSCQDVEGITPQLRRPEARKGGASRSGTIPDAAQRGAGTNSGGTSPTGEGMIAAESADVHHRQPVTLAVRIRRQISEVRHG